MNKETTVYNYLNDHNIKYEVIEHPAVYTIEEMEQLNLDNTDDVVKNLFIKDDKKNNFYLIVLDKNKKVNLKNLRQLLNSRPLSFASEKYLNEYLNLTTGAVSPLGIINNNQRNVIVILDKDLNKKQKIAVHPNVNTATLWLDYADLKKLITDLGNQVIEIEI